jgi:hypothetical protein
MFSTLLMGGGRHTREKDHQNVKSLIIFAHDCRAAPDRYFCHPARFQLCRIVERYPAEYWILLI